MISTDDIAKDRATAPGRLARLEVEMEDLRQVAQERAQRLISQARTIERLQDGLAAARAALNWSDTSHKGSCGQYSICICGKAQHAPAIAAARDDIASEQHSRLTDGHDE